MTSKQLVRSRALRTARAFVAVVCTLVLLVGDPGLPKAFAVAFAQDQPASDQGGLLPADQLDSLVAPIALYPDPLLGQMLVASTYPLEIMQLSQWLAQNKNLKDKALTDAVMKQNWDPSVQALAPLPDAVKILAENIKWTTDLGNAFLAQQSDVMDAVQRMRAKAKGTGNLKSTEQQKVETKVVEKKEVIVIEPASTQVVYVPSYNPTVVYGAPVYPYPPVAYPPPGYYAAGMAISFGVGMMMGAAWGGGWGWGCGWGGNNVNINVNNNFVNNYNRNNVNNRMNNGNWQHNPQHRGAAPYSNRATANKYGGSARGDSMQSRQNNARQNQARQQSGNRGASAGTMDRGAGGRQGSGTSAGTRDMSRGGSGGGGGGDRVGNRSVPNTPSSRNSSAFGGAGSGMSGSGARASSSRGASSMGSRGGGGMSRGGGGGRRR